MARVEAGLTLTPRSHPMPYLAQYALNATAAVMTSLLMIAAALPF